MPFKMSVKSSLLVLACTVSLSANAIAESPAKVDIPAGDLSVALQILVKQSGAELIYRPEQLQGVTTRGVRGTLLPTQAIAKLLEGTTLAVHADTSGVLLITSSADMPGTAPAQPAQSAPERQGPAPMPPVGSVNDSVWDRIRMAQADQGSSTEEDSRATGTGAGAHDISEVEEVTVTGTRFSGRSVLSSPVPVDVVSSADLRASARTELAESLAAAVPAFNYSVVSSASTFSAMRSFTYRGLPPNETLVLVNGKRWHQAGISGALTFDFNSLAPTAVRSVEVLRDGAAAQYGSDAIAGVINIQLRDDIATELVATSSQFYEGDGLTLEAALDTGLQIGENGFLHVSGYYRNADQTNRQGRDVRQQYFARNASGNPVLLATTSASDATPILPGGFSFDPRELTGVDRLNNNLIGNSAREEAGFSFNSEIGLTEGLTLYGFGGYAHRSVETPFLWRRPLQDETVRAIYPDGYLPIYDTRISDVQLAAGVKGKAGEWDWDVSESWGFNRIAHYADNTLNASYGAASQTSFFVGTHRLEQATTNLDARRELSIGLSSPLRLALGAEYRHEGVEIGAGEPTSYLSGGALILDGPRAGLPAPIGSQGIAGFAPGDVAEATRNSVAGYIDLENQITDSFLLTLAGRYEHYDDFGSTVNGKLSLRQEISPLIAIRGSASTGFRAPSLYESYFSTTSSSVIGGQFFVLRNFPVADPVAQALGATPLKPEESENYSLGSVLTLNDRLHFTADVYRIYVRDTIIRSSLFTGAGVTNFLASRGFTGVSAASFFTNAVDKKVDGLDLTGSYRTELANGMRLTLSAGVNFNDTEVLSVAPTPAVLAAVTPTALFDRQQVVRVERGAPRSRVNLAATYGYRNFHLALRGTRYGSTRELGTNPALTDQIYDARWITDLDMSYDVTDALRLTVGAQNLFDVYPEKNNPFNTFSGSGILTYPNNAGNAPFGYSGGQYYARALLRF